MSLRPYIPIIRYYYNYSQSYGEQNPIFLVVFTYFFAALSNSAASFIVLNNLDSLNLSEPCLSLKQT